MGAGAMAAIAKLDRVFLGISLALFAWAAYQRFVAGDVTGSASRFVLLTAAMAVLNTAAVVARPALRGLAIVASGLMLLGFFGLRLAAN